LSALSGRGIAIVRYALVKQLIATNQLVQLHSEYRWPLKWSYYLVTPQQKVSKEVKVSTTGLRMLFLKPRDNPFR
jgi:LysR family glycine cleavage system transcriptional activator